MAKNVEKNSDSATVEQVLNIEISDEQLRDIQSIDDALELMRSVYGAENIFTADQIIGNGFRILSGRDKDRLIGVALVFVKWTLNPSRYGNDYFVSAMVVTESREKFILNDSGGMGKQLAEVTDKTGRTGGLVARHGLTRSDFEFCEVCRSSRCADEAHVLIPAFTHYIDVSA